MTKWKLLDHLIRELNTMTLISEQGNTYSQKIRFKNPNLTYQDRGVMEIQRYVDSKDGFVTWGGYRKSLTQFELLLLEGIVSANHSRILYF